MKPLVAIVGRPNVGKSTLFNRLVGERLAIVEDLPGTTRDRLYADAEWNGRTFSLVDTGGLELGTSEDITARIASQAQLAIEEADVIVLLVDTESGITEADAEVAEMLRRSGKPVVLGANKADNLIRRQEAVEFYSLGLGEPITLAANSGTGTGDLLDAITEHLPPADEEDEPVSDGIPRLAIVGRPNVGKSSLLNAIAGSDRVIVSDIPGTTRDAIDTEVEYKGRRITLIDTAGIRRRGHIGPGVEKYSVLRADRAIDRCDVAVLMIDGWRASPRRIRTSRATSTRRPRASSSSSTSGTSSGAPPRGRGHGPTGRADPAERECGSGRAGGKRRRGVYGRHARAAEVRAVCAIVFAAAKTSTMSTTSSTTRCASTIRAQFACRPATQRDRAQRGAAAPSTDVQGRPLRIFYVTQAETNPPTFVFFVNDPELLHFSYRRYLENQLRNVFGFEGTAIRLQFRARTTDRGEEDEKQGKDKGKSRPGQKYTGKRPTTRSRR